MDFLPKGLSMSFPEFGNEAPKTTAKFYSGQIPAVEIRKQYCKKMDFTEDIKPSK